MTTRTTMPADRSRTHSRRGRPRAIVVMTVGAAASAALALTACTGGDPAPPATSSQATVVISQPGPSPTPSPSISIPANLTPAEAEAAANAVEAYKQWVAAVDVMAQSGGSNLTAIRRISAQTALIYAQNEAAIFLQNKWRATGQTEIRRITVDRVALEEDSDSFTVPEVILAGCNDSSKVLVVDSQGSAVFSDKRVFEYKTWVRNYPTEKWPGVGPGVKNWVVGQYQNHEVDEC